MHSYLSTLVLASALGSFVLNPRSMAGVSVAQALPGDAAGRHRGQESGTPIATLLGELRQWHKVTLSLAGPEARESEADPNPFLDYRLTVDFTHESGSPNHTVPGYFAADGNAADSGADSGNQWHAHLSPDKPGLWTYKIHFVQGPRAAIELRSEGRAVPGLDGLKGSFRIQPSNKKGRDFRGSGRLQYVGGHYLRFAGSGAYFLKAGADAPENLLAYEDFDGTYSLRHTNAEPRAGEAAPKGLHRYAPHLRDWRSGDPQWRAERGRGLIGALNYLADTGANAFSFLPYNVGGDGHDVWPFVHPTNKLHFDCSKLDQWQRVFDHATARGLYLHFKLQETEMDDNRHGNRTGPVSAALDGGDLGVERKLYLRELVARFSHELALNWNLGEENTQSPEQQRAMAQFLHDLDPYDHLIVVHTYPDWQDRVYRPLLGTNSALMGASLQNSWNAAHQRVFQWVTESAQAGKPWVVAHDEQNPPEMGVPTDPGYQGHDGIALQNGKPYTFRDIRKYCLWGTLMAGGAGVEYYFGYKLPQNDLQCEDWRSRDSSWRDASRALRFFHKERVPFWEMTNVDALVGNPGHGNTRYCLAKAGEVYLVYLPEGGSTYLDLSGARGTFTVAWVNPRMDRRLQAGSVRKVRAPGLVHLGDPPADPGEDWAVLVRRR